MKICEIQGFSPEGNLLCSILYRASGDLGKICHFIRAFSALFLTVKYISLFFKTRILRLPKHASLTIIKKIEGEGGSLYVRLTAAVRFWTSHDIGSHHFSGKLRSSCGHYHPLPSLHNADSRFPLSTAGHYFCPLRRTWIYVFIHSRDWEIAAKKTALIRWTVGYNEHLCIFFFLAEKQETSIC